MWAIILAGWLISIGWLVAPTLSGRGLDWQWLAWIPDWAWAAATLPSALLGCVLATRMPRGRIVAGVAAVGASTLPLSGVLERDLGWTSEPVAPLTRLAFLNAQSPDERTSATVLEDLLQLDADYYVIVNPGWIPRQWRRRNAEAGQEPWSVQWLSPVMLASRAGRSSIRTVVAEDGIWAMAIQPPPATGLPVEEDGGVGSILLVDLPSDPDIDREQVADTLLAALAERGLDGFEDFQLVLGDFNMTPRTPALGRLQGRLADLVSESGDGWLGTWPRKWPALRIDHIFAASAEGMRVRTFDPGVGGHRGFIVDVPGEPMSPTARD